MAGIQAAESLHAFASLGAPDLGSAVRRAGEDPVHRLHHDCELGTVLEPTSAIEEMPRNIASPRSSRWRNEEQLAAPAMRRAAPTVHCSTWPTIVVRFRTSAATSAPPRVATFTRMAQY